MFKENEKVTLNGKDYIISQIEWSKGPKACMQCAAVNGRPPCIEAFDYPESNDMFNSRTCSKEVPEFCIPKLAELC